MTPDSANSPPEATPATRPPLLPGSVFSVASCSGRKFQSQAPRVFGSRGRAESGNLSEVKTKLPLLAIVLLAAALALAAAEPATSARAAFRAEVVKFGPLSLYKGSSVSVHSNPRFFLKLRIEGAPAAPLEWKSGDVVVLAIHSWIALFGDEPKVGAVYGFSVGVEQRGGKLRYSDLRVESPPPR